MTLYRRGAMGGEVERIQQRLKALNVYSGLLDGVFGGGTTAAVRAFQRMFELVDDGIVGPTTWAKLFENEEFPRPEITQRNLAYRCLALTGAFETSTPPPECFCGLSGDFDEQGLSFGALQWCIGQGSLQPLLKRMVAQHPAIVAEIFDDHGDELRAMLEVDLDEQMAWARGIQATRNRVNEPWRGMFKTLGRCAECQKIQVEAASDLFQDALQFCRDYGLTSQRAVALMFDIRVQNGSINRLVDAQIRQDFRMLEQAGEEQDEERKLYVVAERRAAAANPRWVNDVRRRKLTIATGRGTVHGSEYDLEMQFDITLAASDDV